ncbi:MAG: hypothetical protein HN712_17380 [Gemmatimonadetes bacterium]|jgi:3',5'-cyclic AMP phosphodiesterase CpdA|nr:hypothetical protein [Gemmatimonadota bacterium]MBT6146997.1 hypothetical protein [Gemmatimonadota bacterium]MBT7862092.1 hypothetical protein [Gemmatimonadota bacterium]
MASRFVVVTDTHYHPTAEKDWGAPKMLTRSAEVLQATVPAINALQPEFVIHGGDLVCGGGSFDLSTPDYERSIADVAQAYAGFSAPVHYVPGNHDCDAQTSSFEPLFEAFPMPRILDVVDVAPGLRLALANIYHSGGLDGNWTDELNAALRQADADARARRIGLLLILHEWVLPGYVRAGRDYDAGCVGDAQRLRQTLIECPSVVATFSGHQHINRIRLWRDVLIVDTACLIGYPLGFREITVDDDGFMESRFHVLNCPDLLADSEARSTLEQNQAFAGEVIDRDTTVLLPRLQRILRN